MISLPLPRYSTSPNPAAAALLSWRYMCLASDCEPLIIITDDSTSEQFTLRPNLEQAGFTFAQTVTQIRITIQHSVIAANNIQWITIPKCSIQMFAGVATRKDGGHFESRHCQKIRIQSTPVRCLSCYDACIPICMHPPMPSRLCPKFKVCKLCWSCETGQPGLTPLAKHLPICPAIFELGAVLSNKTKGTVTSILPSGFTRPSSPPTPRGDTNSIVGKRARASNQLSSDDLQALTSSKFHKQERRHNRSKVATQLS